MAEDIRGLKLKDWCWIDASHGDFNRVWSDIESTTEHVLCYIKEIDSTQTFAKKIPIRNLGDKRIVVVSKKQTSGYGRLGRSWYSEPQQCLAFTWISAIHQNEFLAWLPLVTALTVSETVAHWVDDETMVDVKWPNDVLISHKKVSGILMENKMVEPAPIVYTGIGVNIGELIFPEEIKNIATSIFDHCRQHKPSKVDFLSLFIEQYTNMLDCFQNGGIKGLKKAYLARSSYADGKTIAFQLDGKRIEATTCGLSDQGELCCRESSGKFHQLNISEIESVRPT